MIRIYLFLFLFFQSYLQASGQVIAYHPNKHWHVPGKYATDDKKYPFRYFGPQFSFPNRLEQGQLSSKEWDQWMKTNQFSYSYLLAGHAWNTVLLNNKEYFKKHPEFLAEVDGKRPGYGKTNKFCVSNKQFQKFFIQDRLKAFEAFKDPHASVSVEPSDGDGFCECDDCKKLGSISNQVFHLANLTAKAIREKHPNGKVNLYAYYKHAEIPGFDLEPNVHVTVIPEGFQTLYDADVMMALWAKKARIKTYYEYFAIPQWKGEQPRLHMQDFIRRMKMAKKLGYQGYWFETGLNINATIALQLFNQLWLRPEATWEDVSEEFLRSSFPRSYQPMKELFNRWWFTWMPDNEIAMALNNLEEASALARDKNEIERINDLKAYVHYLLLYQEWHKDKNNSAKTSELFDYLMQTNSRMLLNTNSLYQVFYKHLTAEQRKKYSELNKNEWSWVRPLNHSLIQQNFKADIKITGKKTNAFNYSGLENGLSVAVKKGKPVNEFKMNSQFSEKIQVAASGNLTIKLINPVDVVSENDKGLYLSISSIDGSFAQHVFFPYHKPEMNITLPAKSIYTISFNQFFSTTIQLKGNLVPILTAKQYKSYNKKDKPDKDPEKSYYYITRE